MEDKNDEDKIQLPDLDDLESGDSESLDSGDVIPDDPADIKIDDVIASVSKTDDPTLADAVPNNPSVPAKSTKKGFHIPHVSGFIKSDGDNKVKLPGILLILVGIIALIFIIIFVVNPSHKQSNSQISSSTKVTSSSNSKKATSLTQSSQNKILSAPTDNQQATIYSQDTVTDRYLTMNDAMSKKENLNIFYHNAILRFATGKTNQTGFSNEMSPIIGQLESLLNSIPTSYKTTDAKSYSDLTQAIGSLISSTKAVATMTKSEAVNEFNTSTHTQATFNSQFLEDVENGLTKHSISYKKTTDKNGGVSLEIGK